MLEFLSEELRKQKESLEKMKQKNQQALEKR